MNIEALREKYMIIHELLVEEYGQPTWRPHLPPVDELVSTILSQNTSDVNRDKAFEALKKRYDGWQEVMKAPAEEVIETIRPAWRTRKGRASRGRCARWRRRAVTLAWISCRSCRWRKPKRG